MDEGPRKSNLVSGNRPGENFFITHPKLKKKKGISGGNFYDRVMKFSPGFSYEFNVV